MPYDFEEDLRRRIIPIIEEEFDIDLPFADLDGPYYPEVASSLLVLEDAETGKRFHIKNDGLFVIEDDTTVGRYLAFLPKKTIGRFNAGRFVLAAVEVGPLYPDVVSGMLVLNNVATGNLFKIDSGVVTVDDADGTYAAFLPESGSKADQEMRFVFKLADSPFSSEFSDEFGT